MDFIDHIRRCNDWDPSQFRPFRVAGRGMGWVRPEFATHLARYPNVFIVDESGGRSGRRSAHARCADSGRA